MRPHRQQPTRLLRPWDSPGKNTSGLPFPSPMHESEVAQSCPTLSDPMDPSTPDLPVHHHSRSLPKLMSIESVMPSNHLILCSPLLLLPSIFPRRVRRKSCSPRTWMAVIWGKMRMKLHTDMWRHEGALTTPCIIRKRPQVTLTAQQVPVTQ